MLVELVGESAESMLAYVCGPPMFVKDVETLLVDLGLTSTRVRTEDSD
jgi:ferredoxin-NADP reductase